VTLEHLILIPYGQLANRMRAIASAKRVSQMVGARCSIVWNWPDYEALFQRDPSISLLPSLPEGLEHRYHAMRTLMNDEGGVARDPAHSSRRTARHRPEELPLLCRGVRWQAHG